VGGDDGMGGNGERRSEMMEVLVKGSSVCCSRMIILCVTPLTLCIPFCLEMKLCARDDVLSISCSYR